VLDRRRRGTPSGILTCLCAGLRAVELLPRDGLELLSQSCSRARRRRAMCLCVCRSSSIVCLCRERSAPLRRLKPHPWLPGGCAGRMWRGRVCLWHGCGPRTPPRAQGLAAGQLSCTGGRRDALEPQGDLRPELAVAAQDACVCEPGFVPSMFLQVIA
jgi:hypothetical protein